VVFQWTQCCAIWMAGFIVQFVRDNPPIQPIAMLGGVLWSCGNIMVVPIVKMIGLSLGMLVWGTVSLIAGWSSGNFGLFGMNKEVVAHPALNYLGVTFACLSVVVMIGVKTEVKSKVDPPAKSAGYSSVNDYDVSNPENDSWVEKLSLAQRRVFGLVLAVVSGLLYGVNFDPPTYVMNHFKADGVSQNGLDYVFSHFTGIIVTSTCFLIVYCIIKRNKPVVFPNAILPGFICGFFWAIAQISWFFANGSLPLVVSFPIISTGPGMVASLWGIFAFAEIRGTRNYIVLCVAFACTITSAALTSLSTL